MLRKVLPDSVCCYRLKESRGARSHEQSSEADGRWTRVDGRWMRVTATPRGSLIRPVIPRLRCVFFRLFPPAGSLPIPQPGGCHEPEIFTCSRCDFAAGFYSLPGLGRWAAIPVLHTQDPPLHRGGNICGSWGERCPVAGGGGLQAPVQRGHGDPAVGAAEASARPA